MRKLRQGVPRNLWCVWDVCCRGAELARLRGKCGGRAASRGPCTAKVSGSQVGAVWALRTSVTRVWRTGARWVRQGKKGRWNLACGPEAWFWEQRECTDMICLELGKRWKGWIWVSMVSLWEMDWKVLSGCCSQVEAVTKCGWGTVVWTKGGDNGE